jgi:hypothetical protein
MELAVQAHASVSQVVHGVKRSSQRFQLQSAHRGDRRIPTGVIAATAAFSDDILSNIFSRSNI